MSWPLRYYETRPEQPQVGDMWPAPWLVRGEHTGIDFFLSDAHLAARRAGTITRDPLVVRLPDRTDFCVDGPTFSAGQRGSGGWHVTGEPPAITLTPSINIVGSYHGWIQNGVITDDCEGRKFP